MKSLEQIRKMSSKMRSKFFKECSFNDIERLTEPCTGEAHNNAYIDSCGICLGITWGRMLKRDTL